MELLNLIREKRGIIMKNNIPKGWKPLRIVIKSIRKEKLNEISLLDAHKEGYKNTTYFIQEFNLINKGWSYVESFRKVMKDEMWNPEIWVLEFEVLK